MAKLLDIEGVGPVYAEKLKAAGVGSTGALLKTGATPRAVKTLRRNPGSAMH